MLFDALAKVSTASIKTEDRDRVRSTTQFDDFSFGRRTWIGRGVRRDVSFVALQLAPATFVSRIRRLWSTYGTSRSGDEE